MPYAIAILVFGGALVGTLYGLARVCASANLAGPWTVAVMLGAPIIAAVGIIGVVHVWSRSAKAPAVLAMRRRRRGRHASRSR